MVHVSTPRPSLGAALGNALGGIGGRIAGQEYNRYQTRQGLDKLRQSSQGASPIEQLYNLIEASNYSPAIGKSLGPLYQTLIDQQNKTNIGNVPLTGGGLTSQGQQPSSPAMQQMQQQPFQAGGIGAQGRGPSVEAKKFFPTNVGPNEAPGNLPQEATGGSVKPVWSGEQLLQEGERLYDLWRRAGVTNKTLDDAIAIKQLENNENIAHNARVESERQRRVAEQENYGKIGEEVLKNINPNATDEQKAIFRKKGEDLAGRGKSEADIKRSLVAEATKFRNVISNIEKSLSAPRIQNKLQRTLSGNEKTLDQAQQDARQAIQPLLKDGLYDTARNLISGTGFYPEETENIVFGELPKEVKKSIRDIEKPTFENVKLAQGTPGSPAFGLKVTERQYTPESKENLKRNIIDLWGRNKKNENMNLLQNRKEYEDQGYDWRIYKDALNDLLENGKIEFSDDQTNQFNSYLAEPPLTLLEKILYKLNLRGR